MIAAAVFLYLLCACGREDISAPAVPVLLAQAEGLTVAGESRLLVAPGEAAVFPVTLTPGYVLDSVAGARFDGERIVVDAVRYPTTVVPQTRPAENYFFDLTNDREGGSATFTHSGGLYPEGTAITVAVTPKRDKYFLGFTQGATLRKGGELVCRETEYTFTLTGKTELYANYAAADSDLLLYHAGGGRFAETSGDILAVEIVDSYYLCPNVLIADGTLSRDGHTLLGFTTDEAGEGKLLTPGANVVMPEGRIVHLWPVWAEWTPAEQFTYVDKGESIAITGYTGTGERLVIPGEIGGKKVTRLERGAISGAFETLVFHPNLERVNPNAIARCPNFRTLYFYDTVKVINDRAFADCPEFSTLHLCAAMAPRYTNHRHGTYAKKYERLITAEGPRLAVVSGSSTVYGLDSATLEKALGGRYAVVNYGTHYASSVCFYLEMIAAHVREGDLVIHAPETRVSQFGGNQFEFNLWQMQEGVPEVFACVDIRRYTNVFTSFSAYNMTRSKLKPLTYEDYDDCVNDYGDYFTYKGAKGEDYVKSPGVVNFDASNLTEANAARLNAVAALIEARGGQMLLSFAPSNRNALSGQSTQKNYRNAFVERMDELLDYPRITDPERMLLPGGWFFDSDYHLSTERAVTRAEMLGEDVAVYLNLTHGGTQ